MNGVKRNRELRPADSGRLNGLGRNAAFRCDKKNANIFDYKTIPRFFARMELL